MYDLNHPGDLEVESWGLELDRREIVLDKGKGNSTCFSTSWNNLPKLEMGSERLPDTRLRSLPTESRNGQLGV
jgi:hypothetical protein